MLNLQRFIFAHENWRELLAAKPYCIKIVEEGNLVLFKYSQIDSDFFNGVASGAVNLTDEGTLFLQQGIEKRGFARVSLADNGDGDSLLECVAKFKTLAKCGERIVNVLGEFVQFCPVGKLEFFVVGEVKFEFHEGSQVEQFVSQFSKFSAEASSHL